jgi:hypothetical protein
MHSKPKQLNTDCHGQCINPYVESAKLIKRRLIWDLSPLSRQARQKLKRYRNSHIGEKSVILCNGPSLNNVDFENLAQSKVFTFGLNKINLMFNRSDFRPSCIVCVNSLVIEQNKEFYNSTDIPLFIDSTAKKWIDYRRNITFLHSTEYSGSFARDCSISINQGATVTYVAMQLAFHMGFTQVALVGCDHNFETKGLPHKVVISDEKDQNHFDSRYFANGDSWQLPDLAASEWHYEIARNIYAHHARKIVNCTDGGKLEIFEKMSLADFLNH